MDTNWIGYLWFTTGTWTRRQRCSFFRRNYFSNRSQQSSFFYGKFHYTMIFENISGEWVQIGVTIYGDNLSGSNISISSEGNIVAIATPNGGSNLQGLVRVYENIEGTWIQIGSDILGEH